MVFGEGLEELCQGSGEAIPPEGDVVGEGLDGPDETQTRGAGPKQERVEPQGHANEEDPAAHCPWGGDEDLLQSEGLLEEADGVLDAYPATEVGGDDPAGG